VAQDHSSDPRKKIEGGRKSRQGRGKLRINLAGRGAGEIPILNLVTLQKKLIGGRSSHRRTEKKEGGRWSGEKKSIRGADGKKKQRGRRWGSLYTNKEGAGPRILLKNPT